LGAVSPLFHEAVAIAVNSSARSESGTWSPSGAPGSLDDVSITYGGTATFDLRSTVNSVTIANFTVGSTASLTNAVTGTMNIQRDNAAGLTTHAAFLQMDASVFNNQGAINIKSYAVQLGTAQFRAPSVDFSNAGAITIDGPRSSIEMATRTFTQSAGSLSLVNGGTMTAGSVLINSGTLLGTGSIDAPVTIGGILSPGSDSGGARAVVCVARPEPSLPLGRK